MKRKYLYWIIQFTWGFPQNLIGLLLFLLHRRNGYFVYHGAVVCQWKRTVECMGIGMFIFICENENMKDEEFKDSFILQHEYGHTLQSILLGPLFLLIIGAPSLIWNRNYYSNRSVNNKDYYTFYTEKWANHLSSRIISKKKDR